MRRSGLLMSWVERLGVALLFIALIAVAIKWGMSA